MCVCEIQVTSVGEEESFDSGSRCFKFSPGSVLVLVLVPVLFRHTGPHLSTVFTQGSAFISLDVSVQVR